MKYVLLMLVLSLGCGGDYYEEVMSRSKARERVDILRTAETVAAERFKGGHQKVVCFTDGEEYYKDTRDNYRRYYPCLVFWQREVGPRELICSTEKCL
jgi:hypothetical protein